MKKEICLDELTNRHVNILIKKYVNENGERFYVGEPERVSYQNSGNGRRQVLADIKKPYVDAIMSIWGDEPTVLD